MMHAVGYSMSKSPLTWRVMFASWLSKSAPLKTAPIWSLTGSARVLIRTRRAPSVVVYSSAHCR